MQQCGIGVVDFLLTRSPDFMMSSFDFKTSLLQGAHNGVPVVGRGIHRGDGDVAGLEWHLVAQVVPVLPIARGHGRFLRTNFYESIVRIGAELDGIEKVKLRFGSQVRRVGDAGGLEIRFRLLGHAARIARKRLVRKGIHDGGIQHQGRFPAERIDESRGGVGDQLHIGFMNRGETVDGRPVKHHPVSECFLQHICGDGEVLHSSVKVGKAHVDKTNVFLFHKINY